MLAHRAARMRLARLPPRSAAVTSALRWLLEFTLVLRVSGIIARRMQQASTGLAVTATATGAQPMRRARGRVLIVLAMRVRRAVLGIVAARAAWV